MSNPRYRRQRAAARHVDPADYEQIRNDDRASSGESAKNDRNNRIYPMYAAGNRSLGGQIDRSHLGSHMERV
jgi:hypothetical protein